VIGPLVLGDHVWEQLEGEDFMGWEDFVAAVEEKFGLSHRQVVDAFYQMRPAIDEKDAEFLVRVEGFRVKYG
jgi:hypothetical protein